MVRAIVDVELAAALGGLDVATAVAKKWDKAYREGGPQVFKEGKSHLELLSRLPPWRHGDTVTMTPEAVHARARLRVHPAIVTELQRWWVTATYSTGKDKLDRTGYVCVSRLLAKTMTENYEPNLAQASAEIDFEADAGATDGNGDGNSASGASGSEPTISRREYMDFLFQLTDVWNARTSSMHLASDDFAWYLRSMHDHISRTDDGLRWQWKAEEDVVHHFAHKRVMGLIREERTLRDKQQQVSSPELAELTLRRRQPRLAELRDKTLEKKAMLRMQRMHRLAYYRQAPLVGVAPVYASVAAAVAAAGPVTCPYTGARGQGPARQVAAAGPVTAPRVATSAVAPEVAEAGPVAAPSIAAAGPAAVVRTMVPTLERAPPSAPLDDDEEVEEELQQGPPNMEPSPSVAPMPPPPAQYHLSPPRNHSADGSARRPLTDRPRRPRSTHGHAEIVSRPGSAHGAPNVRSTPIVTSVRVRPGSAPPLVRLAPSPPSESIGGYGEGPLSPRAARTERGYMVATRASGHRNAARGMDSSWLHHSLGVTAPSPNAWCYIEEGADEADPESAMRRPRTLRAKREWHTASGAPRAPVLVTPWGGVASTSLMHGSLQLIKARSPHMSTRTAPGLPPPQQLLSR